MVILKAILRFETGPLYSLGLNKKLLLRPPWIRLPVAAGSSHSW